MARRTRQYLLALLPALALAVAGCATSTQTTGSTDSGIPLVKSGTLTVCTHLPYEPFQFQKDGQTVGFDVDLMRGAVPWAPYANPNVRELVSSRVTNYVFHPVYSGAALTALALKK